MPKTPKTKSTTTPSPYDPAPEPGFHPWQPYHTTALVQGIIEAAYAAQRTIYAHPQLKGQVDGHANNRTSQKLDLVLGMLAREHGVGLDDMRTAKGLPPKKGNAKKEVEREVGREDEV